MRYSHTALSCRDPAATERFYTRYFGFRRTRAVQLGDAQIVFLRSGDAWLELFQAEQPRTGAAPVADGPHEVGLRHLAFQVDDVDAALAALGSAAPVTLGPLDFGAAIPGWRAVWVADPDGNIVEIAQGYVDQADPPPIPLAELAI